MTKKVKQTKHKSRKRRLKKSEIDSQLINKTEFVDILKENTEDYTGDFAEIIVHSPKIYALLCKLLESENITKKYRTKISASIAYFILPRDIFPESIFGPKGYIDDILLCLHTLRELESEYEFETLLGYWDWDVKLLRNLIGKYYDKLASEFSEYLGDMLRYTGLD